MALPDSAQPPVDPLAPLLGYQLRRASAAMMADLSAALAGSGLRVAEASVLRVIEANPDIIQSDIGRMLGIKRANMTPLVGTLEERGLVMRSLADGRSHSLRLTAAGAEAAAEAGRRIAAHEAKFSAALSCEAMEGLMKSLGAIRAAAAED
jgi:DNA-binding MarR family transcriptional regulator